IDEKSIAGLMEYFDENPDQIKNVITNLKNQSKTIDNFKEDKKDYRGYGLVRLAHDGKFLFYDKYELKIESVYLTVETNYKDTVIYVDNNEVGKADEPYFRSEEHTSELQSRENLVCRLLLEKKKNYL